MADLLYGMSDVSAALTSVDVTTGSRHQKIESIQVATLERLKHQHLLRTIISFPQREREDPSRRAFFLSLAIVKYFLGELWIDEHVSPEKTTPGFVRIDTSSRASGERTTYRIVDLAELLFNLQKKQGFDRCVERMRAGEVEPVYAELDFGRMLHGNCIDFRFVDPQSKKGLDFDIEIFLRDGMTVCADAKCKIESTNFSEETVWNSLEGARKQFPADRPSAIFLKVPPRWLHEVLAGQQLLEIGRRFLRRTRRVVSVKFYSASHLGRRRSGGSPTVS